MKTQILSNDELRQINGGTYESGQAAGQAAGAFVRECLDDWGVVNALWSFYQWARVI